LQLGRITFELIMLKHSLAVLLLCSPVFVLSQQGENLLSDFRTQQVGNNVHVNFTIEAGNSYCLGVGLERGLDSVNFEVIAAIAGVCGGSEFAESYLLVDSFPYPNQTNYYRLVLGEVGISEIIPVHFIELEDGMKLFPNPTNHFSKLVFDNPSNSRFNFSLYDATGNILPPYFSGNGSEVIIDTSTMEVGVYVWSLTLESGEMWKGRLAVIRE